MSAQVAAASTLNEFLAVLKKPNVVSLAITSGYTKALGSAAFSQRDHLVAVMVAHQLIGNRLSELHQLCEGLECLGFLKLLRQHPQVLQPLLCAPASQDQLTVTAVLSLLDPKYTAERGSNVYQQGGDTYDLFVRYVEEAE